MQTGWSALADGSALVGSPATRHVGTIGGNIMNSSPAMDTGAALLVLEAEVELRSQGGSRTVALADLWTGPGTTSAQPDELLVSVHVPELPTRSGSAYVRLEYRRAMEIAVVGAAAAVTLNGDGDVEACRVALTAVAPTIVARRRGAEAAIAGTPVDEETLAAVAAGASADASADQRRARRRRLPSPHRRRDGPPRRRGRGRRALAASMSPSLPTAPPVSARPSEAEPMSVSITLNVNGVPYPLSVEPHRTLVSVVRGEVGLTGTKEGCDDCECGACMVLHRRPAGELLLVPRGAGRRPRGHDGGRARHGGELHPLQRNIVAEGGVQCGFCTPGMLISAAALLAANPAAEARTRSASAWAATCAAAPGTQKIVRAVQRTADELAAAQ